MKKQICLLTKSLKDRDYCASGIDLKTGEWIRLVTSDEGGAFPKEMLDNKNIKEFDKIKIPTALIVVSLPAIPYGENELYYKFVAKIII